MNVSHLDHLVLTVSNVNVTIDFYHRVLGMEVVEFGEGRKALRFGEQKINLHQHGAEFEPKAQHVQPGSADLCFITPVPVSEILAHIERQGVTITDGPVKRTGAVGPICSVYFRDPDGNLIEVANRLTPSN
ncbi:MULTISPECIES: VOC family protein [Vibrio]|nr:MULTISPECIES: VOC family protein [Vibrio]NAW56177.1 VOC family protein [Vibrio sp. V36_P2S2PM302]NAX21906.1 VOC family protein [Vibrio sp. V39_P1S14PM300]NAX25756.1 VOC family protein [Vibrio sp. V38_P2S17PM301]NAX32246.1 VOC family protein [Vibrio sp. V37_P2S8PM304]